jgi:mxaJ protein
MNRLGHPNPARCGLPAMLVCASLLTGLAVGDDPRPQPGRRVLRVTADPNNLPFTNERREGFENKIAELIARDLGADLDYTWRAQRRGFFRETLKAGGCDLILGVPAGFERALTTNPYYRSSYVFVSRKDRGLEIHSFDDPRLKGLKIAVQLIGDDGVNTPPAHALAARELVENVRGFTVYGDYGRENPAARIVEAVVDREVDLAVVWGPLAGYLARRRGDLAITPVEPETDSTGLRMVFAIAMGVRKGDVALKREIDAILEKRRKEIEQILREYGVPRLELAGGQTAR